MILTDTKRFSIINNAIHQVFGTQACTTNIIVLYSILVASITDHIKIY